VKHNHLDKTHLCGTGYGCMEVVPGGELSCARHTAHFSDAERAELSRVWDTDERDAVVDRMIARYMRGDRRIECGPCRRLMPHRLVGESSTDNECGVFRCNECGVLTTEKRA
jgi:hypothetical protein